MQFLAFYDMKLIYGKFQENLMMGKRLLKFTISSDFPFHYNQPYGQKSDPHFAHFLKCPLYMSNIGLFGRVLVSKTQ